MSFVPFFNEVDDDYSPSGTVHTPCSDYNYDAYHGIPSNNHYLVLKFTRAAAVVATTTTTEEYFSYIKCCTISQPYQGKVYVTM